MTVAFFIAGAVAVIATIMMITRTRAAHALLYLVVSFLALGLVFYTLGAPFIAALEVIIYAGAIMVLFLFALMLIHPGREDERRERLWMRPRAWIVPGGLAAVLLFELIYLLATSHFPGTAATVGQTGGDSQVKAVGVALFGPYLLGVELASILLLAGLVAAHRLTAGDEPGSESGGETGGAGPGAAAPGDTTKPVSGPAAPASGTTEPVSDPASGAAAGQARESGPDSATPGQGGAA